MASSDQFGSQQLGPYVLVQRLGGGSTGIVYKAQHIKTGQVVAVKVLSPSVARNRTALVRFKQEFDATRNLSHPGIVRALELAQERSLSYLVMEYVEGQSLETRLEKDGKIPEDEAVRMAAQIADALDHAHQHGFIHRDVKPSNILLMPSGGSRLTDFGLVKDLEGGSSLTETASVMGTPNFMAPEQFDDARKVDARSDLYSLAGTLYMAVTGAMPFDARGYMSMVEKKFAGDLVPPRQIVPELSERLERTILRGMSVIPADRPASCSEFVCELTGRMPGHHIRWHTSQRLCSWFGRIRRWIWPYRQQPTRA